ncbi:MAG: hypothetical protein RIQ88_286 [Actinomycetota bacterium]
MANKSSGVGTCFGVGCSVVAFGFLSLLLSLQGNSGAVPFLFLGLVTVIVLIVRSNNQAGSANKPDPTFRPTGPVAAPNGVPQYAPQTGIAKQEFETVICEHSFSAVQLRGKETITCPCGYVFEVELLREYARLRKQVVSAQNDLDAAWRKLQLVKMQPKGTPAVSNYTPATAPKPLPKVAANTATPKATPAPVPAASRPAPVLSQSKPVEVKPVVKRQRATVSVQQWLIFAASFLVIVAGGIFVSTNVANGASPTFYLFATIPFGLATGFMAFWGRKISVILSNFMATFAATMLLATLVPISILLNLGIQGGQWFEFPSYVWATNLLITAGASFFLSRFKGNFGWKIYSLLGFVISMLLYMFGSIGTYVSANEGQFGWFAALATAAGVVLALLNKALRTFTYDLSKVSKDDLEYEKDLVKREDAALERFTRLATLVFGVLAIGYTAYYFVTKFALVEPLSFTAFALVWIAAGAIQKTWIDGLASDEKMQEQINRWVHIVGFTAIALALNSWTRNIQNLWIGVLSTSLLAFVAVILGNKVKRVAAHPVAIKSAQFALPLSFAAWYLPEDNSMQEKLLAMGLLLTLFALSLLLENFYKFSTRTSQLAIVSHILGLAVLVGSLRSVDGVDIASLNYVFESLGIILLAVIYSPISALIAKKHKQEYQPVIHYLLLGLTGALTVAALVPTSNVGSASNYLNTVVLLLIAAVVPVFLGGLKAFAGTVDSLLIKYNYVFQGVLALLLLNITKSNTDLAFVALVLLGVSLLNYVLGFVAKNNVSVQLAFAVGLLGLAVTSYEQLNLWTVSSHLGLSLLAILVLNGLQLFIARKAKAKYSSVVFFATTMVFAVYSLGSNWTKWANLGISDSPEIWVGLAEFIGVAVISAVIAELKVSERLSMILRINALVYLVIAHFSLAGIGDEANFIPRKMITSLIFAVIAFRQLVITSSKDNKRNTMIWFLASYAGPVMLATLVANYLYRIMSVTDFRLDVLSAPLAISLVIPTFFNRSIPKGKRALTALDIPVLVTLGVQIFSGVSVGFNEPYYGLVRFTGALGLIAIFSYWRSMAEKQVRWVYLGFITGGIGGLGLARVFNVMVFSPTAVIPELYSVLLSLSIVVGGFFLAKRITLSETRSQLLRVDVPVLLPVISSIGYATTLNLSQPMNLLRLVLSLLLFSAYAHYKLGRSKTDIWAAATYIGLLGTMLSLVQLLKLTVPGMKDVPELWSIGLAVAILLGNMEVKRITEFKSSLLVVGLPMAALVMPSIFFAYPSFPLEFSQMPQLDIIRIISVLVVALLATVFGVRQGNLGSTVVGGSALALVVLPLTWVRAGTQDGDTTISLRALVIAAVLFAVFALLRRADRVPDSSYIYIGIPTAVGLIPSLWLSLAALNNPKLTNVDWWRFGIILTVSLVLLIVGALRELGGMFFPGLVGVIAGVLPYAFKQVSGQDWFIWVILLLIAGIMVWIAVRLEQMRKLGKSSVSWVKALK